MFPFVTAALASEPTAPPPSAPDEAAFAAVTRALSSRDPVACAAVEALTPTPAATLLQVVDTVEMPPWAPMKAADCLVRNHAEEVRPRLGAWVADPALAGLGRLVLGHLDTLPVEIAVEVARAAVAGSDPDLARQRIAASARPEVRAVAPAAPSGVAR